MKNKNKKIKVLIPNATGPRNVGDQAMLEVLVGLIQKSFKNVEVVVHSTDPRLYKNKSYRVKHTLYSWSVFRETEVSYRIIYVSKLFSQYMLYKLGARKINLDKSLMNLLNDYRNADLIVFVGGGYLRSRKGFRQSLNIIMQIMLFKFAGTFQAKKIVAPISVGPFAYSWQEKLIVEELKKQDLVALREEVSFKLLRSYKLSNIILSSDHALMIKKLVKKDTKVMPIIGFTIREWLKGSKQNKFMSDFANALAEFAKFSNAKILPIVQVDAALYGENDAFITRKIMKMLNKSGIETLDIKKIRNVEEALKVYSNIDLLVGMRMHSNILAAVQGTPFIAVSYEHKTEGIAKQLVMEKYCIRCSSLTKNKLYKMMVNAYMNKTDIRIKLNKYINNIQINEQQNWSRLLVQSI
jgi:colanic acid/amylovoran biosynthesis protein